jgi:hypothetical protein
MQREMTTAAGAHRSGPRALLTVFGLGTAAAAGAAIALAVGTPPRVPHRRLTARRRPAALLDASYRDFDGAGLFV